MILSKFARQIGVDPTKIHPSFNTFDKAVTILVFIDIVPKLGHLLETFSAVALFISIHTPFKYM